MERQGGLGVVDISLHNLITAFFISNLLFRPSFQSLKTLSGWSKSFPSSKTRIHANRIGNYEQ